MNFQIVFSSVSLIIFGGFVVLAIMGFRSIGKATEKTAGHKETGRMLAAQRPRVLRPRRSERRAGLLPPDATVTFSAERRAADIGEGVQATWAGGPERNIGLEPCQLT